MIPMRTSTIYHCELIFPSNCNHLHLVLLTNIVGFSDCRAICGALDSYECEEYEDMSNYQCCLKESQGSHNFLIPTMKDFLDVQLMMTTIL